MIHLSHVTKTYGAKRAVDDVSFDVAPGESLALWGSNGAGKTTLIRCMLGSTDYRGDVTIHGIHTARQGKQARARIGYVPQMMPSFDMSVGEMVLLVAQLRRVSPKEGIDLLERFGLTHTKKQSVGSLSGGMRQKLALTLALLGSPPVLMFDEPTANLDAKTQEELIHMLADLKQQGRTIVFTSHRWSEVRALADTVVHLENGKMIEHGSVARLAIVTDRSSIRIEFDPTDVERAMQVLRDQGFDTIQNGNAAIVTIQDRHKIEPFDAVTKHGIAIQNFDIEVKE